MAEGVVVAEVVVEMEETEMVMVVAFQDVMLELTPLDLVESCRLVSGGVEARGSLTVPVS
jgi:hypothetical protein